MDKKREWMKHTHTHTHTHTHILCVCVYIYTYTYIQAAMDKKRERMKGAKGGQGFGKEREERMQISGIPTVVGLFSL
jgi:hypothetical protein